MFWSLKLALRACSGGCVAAAVGSGGPSAAERRRQNPKTGWAGSGLYMTSMYVGKEGAPPGSYQLCWTHYHASAYIALPTTLVIHGPTAAQDLPACQRPPQRPRSAIAGGTKSVLATV